MTRYGGWRRLTGNAAGRPDLLDLGKRLLGYLAGQRDLSGVPSHEILRRLPDGSLVRARWIGEHPQVDIVPGVAEPPPTLSLAAGIVTKPRKFGTGASNDGQNAYGQFAHNILIPRDDGWTTAFYDDSYKPEGYERASSYRTTSAGRALFEGGLARHGNVDWTSADGLTCITWVGFPGRTGLIANWSAGHIYHNGRLVLDHAVIDWRSICGACVRQFPEGLYLVYVVGSSNSNSVSVYAAPVEPDLSGDYAWLADKVQNKPRFAPQWELVPAEAIVHLGDFTAPGDGSGANGMRYFAFNAAGTEARAIAAQDLAGEGFDQSLRFDELILTVTSPVADGAHITAVSRGTYTARRTTSQTYERCTPNVYNIVGLGFEYTGVPEPGPSAPLGTFVATPNISYTPQTAYMPSGSNPAANVLVGESILTTATEVDDYGPFPIAVDYEDEVPVYLWWSPETLAATATRDCSWSQSTSASGYASTTYVQRYHLGSPDGTYVGSSTTQRDYENAASGTRTETFSEQSTRAGQVFAIDKDGNRWLEMSYDSEGSGSVYATASLQQEHSHLAEFTSPDGTDNSGARSSSYTASYTATLYRRTTSPCVWFLDLRSRSAVYSVYTHESTQTNSVSTTCIASEAIDNDSNLGYRYPYGTRTVAGTQTNYTKQTVDTRLVFGGSQVRRMASVLESPSTTPSTVTTPTYTPTPQDVAMLIFGTYGTPMPTVIFGGINSNYGEPQASQAAALEDTFLPDTMPPYDAPVDLAQSGSVTPDNTATSWDFSYVRVEADDVFAATNGNKLTNEGTYSWVRNTGDFEPTSGTYLPRYSTRYGTWIYHQKRWAYSMPDLDRPDPSTPLYTHGISNGGDLAELTGDRPGVELYEAMWPLSTCVVQIK